MGTNLKSMRQLMERLELDLVEAKKVPPLEDAKEQKSRILLFPKDFTEQGWSALLYQLHIGPEKHFGVGAITVQRIEIGTSFVRVAFNTKD